MKKILFLLSALTLLSYGCNRNEDAGTATDSGMQQEETRDLGTAPEAVDSPEASPTTETMDSDIQEPEMQEEEMRDDYQTEEDLNAVPADEQSGSQQ